MKYQIINFDKTSRVLIKKLLKNGKTCFACFQKTSSGLKFVRPSDENEWNYANEAWSSLAVNVSYKKDPFPILLKSECFVYVFFEESNLIRLFKKTKKTDYSKYSEVIQANIQAGLAVLFRKIANYNKNEKYYIEKFGINNKGKVISLEKTPLIDGLKKWILKQRDRNISLTFTL